MMVSQTVEENKLALDCRFKPKIATAHKKIAKMEEQLKEELRQRDNQKEMRSLQDQIDQYQHTLSKMQERVKEYTDLD